MFDEKGNTMVFPYSTNNNETIYYCHVTYIDKREQRHIEIDYNNIIVEILCVINYSPHSNDTIMTSTNTMSVEECMESFNDYPIKGKFNMKTHVLVGSNEFLKIVD